MMLGRRLVTENSGSISSRLASILPNAGICARKLFTFRWGSPMSSHANRLRTVLYSGCVRFIPAAYRSNSRYHSSDPS